VAEKKFHDMDPDERFDDLRDRVEKFNMLQLPGQPQGMHMGTSYLIGDLWRMLQKDDTSFLYCVKCGREKASELVEISWVTDPPTEPGWYWWRQGPGDKPHPLFATQYSSGGEWWPVRFEEKSVGD